MASFDPHAGCLKGLDCECYSPRHNELLVERCATKTMLLRGVVVQVIASWAEYC